MNKYHIILILFFILIIIIYQSKIENYQNEDPYLVFDSIDTNFQKKSRDKLLEVIDEDLVKKYLENTGIKGDDGKGIENIELEEDDLEINYTDGTNLSLQNVKGSKGPILDDCTRLGFPNNCSNSLYQPIIREKKGENQRNITDISFDPSVNKLKFEYSSTDGSTEEIFPTDSSSNIGYIGDKISYNSGSGKFYITGDRTTDIPEAEDSLLNVAGDLKLKNPDTNNYMSISDEINKYYTQNEINSKITEMDDYVNIDNNYDIPSDANYFEIVNSDLSKGTIVKNSFLDEAIEVKTLEYEDKLTNYLNGTTLDTTNIESIDSYLQNKIEKYLAPDDNIINFESTTGQIETDDFCLYDTVTSQPTSIDGKFQNKSLYCIDKNEITKFNNMINKHKLKHNNYYNPTTTNVPTGS